MNNHIIVPGKMEGKHARNKSQYAEASPHFSKRIVSDCTRSGVALGFVAGPSLPLSPYFVSYRRG